MNKEKYTEGLVDALKDDIRYNISAGIEIPLTDYLDKTLEILKRRYQLVNKWGRFHTWSRENLKEVIHIWEEAKPDIIKDLENYIKTCRSRKMTREIKITSARVLIREAMQEAGLKYHFEGQAYRAKVTVQLNKTRAIIVYILYSKINEILPKTVEALKIIKQNIEFLGENTTFVKVYSNFEWN